MAGNSCQKEELPSGRTGSQCQRHWSEPGSLEPGACA
jgi:hypothetical protein